MHAIKLLHKRLLNTRAIKHRYRLNALLRAVEGLLKGGKLTLTHLGRNLPGVSYEKHKIKCMDRLLGNPKLHKERFALYRQMGIWLLSKVSRPLIVVDWSDVYEGQQFVMLTAAIPLGSRALTLYEKVYPMKQYNSPKAHKQFLQALSQVVPQRKHPIIITDAGFRGPWFREVEALGWDWVGRIRKGVYYSLNEGAQWHKTSQLYKKATQTIKAIGRGFLSKKRPYECHLYLVKKNNKSANRPLKRYGDKTMDVLCRKLYRDPWLIATSLPHNNGSAKRVEKMYTLRMQIEENFRDIKNGRWGLGLEYARSYRSERLDILLVIGTLGVFVLWLNGVIAKSKGWMKRYQVNTERRYSVLSVFFLGRRLISDEHFKSSKKDFATAFRQISDLAQNQVNFVGIY